MRSAPPAWRRSSTGASSVRGTARCSTCARAAAAEPIEAYASRVRRASRSRAGARAWSPTSTFATLTLPGGELRAYVRVCDRDQGFASRVVGEPGELRRAVLRDHDVDLVARRRDAGAGSERGHDARDRTVLCARLRRQTDQRATALGERGARHEVLVPADPGILPAADIVSDDLPVEIHGQRAVDRHDGAVARDD